MATAVIMPRQGQSVESCIITAWNKKVGDTVAVGDILFSYETDKSSFDEAAQVAGKLLAIFAEEGDDVPCLQNVCVIGNDGESFAEFAPAGEEASAPVEEEKVAQAVENVPAASVAEATAQEVSGAISPRARALAEKTGADLLKATPTGPNGRIIERDVQSLVDRGLTVSGAARAEYTSAVEGSGINGKVMLGDLSAPVAPIAEVAVPAAPVAEYEDVKLPNIRKIIAKQMCASLNGMAQLTFNSSFDATKMLELRKSLKAGAEKMGLNNITLNDMILYAVSRVLLDFKGFNAHCLGDTMRYFNTVNLGIAVDTERGLMVPTVFGAEKMSLNELATAAKTVIKEAQGGTISPDKLRGGSFTVTNLGALGIESFTPVINPPQTGILGVCGIERKLKEVDGKDVSYPAMGLSLTFDHRALDGAPAAKFLKELCFTLENFNLMLVK